MLRMLLACAIVGSSLIAYAPYVQTSTQAAAAERTSVSDAVCVDIMGLWTGEVYYPRCQESVAYILAGQTKRQTMLFAYKDCKQAGLEEGTASFSSCMLESKPAVTAPVKIVASADPEMEPGKRFDDISPAIQLNRERYACAQRGLLPESGPFDDRVYSLDDALIPNKY